MCWRVGAEAMGRRCLAGACPDCPFDCASWRTCHVFETVTGMQSISCAVSKIIMRIMKLLHNPTPWHYRPQGVAAMAAHLLFLKGLSYGA